jgi:transcription antitermination protein NusB
MKNSARYRARAFALQGLYQWMLSGSDPSAIRGNLSEASGFAKCDHAFFDVLWSGVTDEFQVLVDAFAPYLDRAPSEVSPIEKAILVIGAFEILRSPEIPYRVAINEAVELAKAYGGTDGHRYVNGVLDKLAASARATEISASRVAS